jgi:hypothetical protein
MTENRLNELGWFQAALTPAVAIFVENMGIIQDNNIAKKMAENNRELIKRNYDEVADVSDDIFDDNLADILGNLAYFILPGSDKIYDIIEENNIVADTIKSIPLIGEDGMKVISLGITAYI